MRALTPEAEEFFSDQWSRYIEYIESEHGFTKSAEYLDHVGRLNDPELEPFLEERDIPIDIFYQIMPMTGQPVMYSSLNPGMSDNYRPSKFQNEHEYGRKVESVGDPEALARTIALNMDGYLTSSKHPGVKLIIQTMRDNLDPIDSTQFYDDYVNVDSIEELDQRYLGQIYLSRVYKFPSPSKDELVWSDIKFGRKTFAEEMEFVDPELLVCGCRDAWMTVYREIVEDPQEEIEAHNGSNVSSKYGGGSNSARDGAFYLPENDLWIVTVGHEGWRQFIHEDSLADNLEYVNERIAW